MHDEQPETVRVTGTHDDIVQVTRKWDIEAPDFTPRFKSRAVAPRHLMGQWLNGKLVRVGLWGPHRLKSGALGQFGGTGGHGYGDEFWLTGVKVDEHGRPTHFSDSELPDWVWVFLAEHGPVL